MILNGNSRAHGQELARHLLNIADNEHAVVHELRGFISEDLPGAFKEIEAVALGTQCEQYLFSLSLNPPKLESVSEEEFETVLSTIEKRLGLTGQPRAIVFHEKKGRRHAHCVWSRIDVEKMRAVNLPHFKRKLTDISREIYQEFGWEMPAGLRDHEDGNRLNYSHAEAGQAKRARRDPAKLKEMFQSCWEASDSAPAFAAALREHGYCLARGDRRGFVAVGASGEVYSLSRWCGVKSRILRGRLGDGSDLPGVEDAIASLAGRQVEPGHDQSFNRQFIDHSARLADLVARQREERQSLQETQRLRRDEEIRAARDRLPKGLSAVWARLTGGHQKLVRELEKEAGSRHTRDRTETEALIEKHLAERRQLDRQYEFLAAQSALEAEYLQEPAAPVAIYRPDPRQPLLPPREDVPFTPRQLRRKPGLILAHISDKQARFTRNNVVRGLAEFIDDPLELRVALDQALLSSDLVPLDETGQDVFTTRDYQETEKNLLSRASVMAGSGGFGVKIAHFDRAIRRANIRLKRIAGARLSDEQVSAIRHVVAANQLSAVVGLAGTGKSTLLSVAREAWERQGFRVHGAALAGKAADSLESASGISSRTLASLEASWKNGNEPLSCGDILVIDEVGMVGTRQLARIAARVQELGCKLVLIGDPEQLQPIQAGTPFRDIVENADAARLCEIRRQSTEWQRQASRDLADGFVETALREYADHGAVSSHDDRDQAIAALVADYVADWQASGETNSRLALAHRRKDVHAINQAIRMARSRNYGPEDEVMFQTDHGPRAFGRGDRILFTSNEREMGVRNGMLGKVEKVGSDNITVQLDAANSKTPRQLSFSPRDFPAIDHGFAVTIHRAQGCTVDRSFVLSSRTLDRHLTYVALTRHRKETGLYTAPAIDTKWRRSKRERSLAPNLRNSSAPSRSR